MELNLYMTTKTGNEIRLIYNKLYKHYGPQGWWPLLSMDSSTETDVRMVYHPLNYDLPKTRNETYEIILGTILTQNTAWNSAEMALRNLKALNAIDPENLLGLDTEIFKQAIRSAGFLNQKSVYIKEVTKFYIALDGKIPKREELLEVKGVGNETADSILLYAFKQPEFVVDTYTKRIFSHIGLIDYNYSYNKIKNLFETHLSQDMIIYNEYHALIVEHAKKYYSRKPYGVDDPLF
jgi:endonuclease-3 related protein